LWHGKIYCGNVYHGRGDDAQFSDQELIDRISAYHSQGGDCTLDWPFDPKMGLLKSRQMGTSGPRPAKNAVVEVGLTMEVPPLSVDKLPCEHTHKIKLT
jgi:hypothetical protein